MKRVIVIGAPGSGKSTLSRRLAAATGLPHIELDKLAFKDDGHMIPREDWLAINEELSSRDRWIIDGPYMASLDMRLKRADTVIVVQPGRFRCFYQWIKREARSKDQWLRWRWRALHVVWSWAGVAMPRIWAKIEINALTNDYKVHHLLNKDQIEKFISGVEVEMAEAAKSPG